MGAIAMTEEKMHEPGHEFLARLGKTRLRPGGREATGWLGGYNFQWAWASAFAAAQAIAAEGRI